MAKRKTLSYHVFLPQGVSVPGYNSLELTGRTEAVSRREAVSHLIARQLSRERDKIALIMNELDINHGGAENYAFSQQEPPEILQDIENLKKGSKLTLYEKKLLREQAFAYNLARLDEVDTSNPETQMHYIEKARFLMKKH
ncbi:hypothetical protein J4429_02185 [Candidatus Pacearchaeota archaeon]|nr:hypothetical protein [Candidatus Pacearchaeota archaeon]